MARLATAAALVATVFAAPALAQQATHELGQHPAVIVKQQWASKGYDYASKFYPHPAWLYLYNEAPQPVVDDPARFAGNDGSRAASAKVAAAPALHKVSTATP